MGRTTFLLVAVLAVGAAETASADGPDMPATRKAALRKACEKEWDSIEDEARRRTVRAAAGTACIELAESVAGPEDARYHTAAGLYLTACWAGYDEACKKAEESARRAFGECENATVPDCHPHVAVFLAADILKQREMIRYWRELCASGELGGYIPLGDELLRGRYIDKDTPEAARLYEKACEAGRGPEPLRGSARRSQTPAQVRAQERSRQACERLARLRAGMDAAAAASGERQRAP